MLKDDDDYLTPDEDGDDDPSSVTTTRTDTVDRTSNTGDNGTILQASSVENRHELATRDDPLNSSPPNMVANGNVLAGCERERFSTDSSILSAGRDVDDQRVS